MMMPASHPVSIKRYLETSYRPDVEYLNGGLRERPPAYWIHSRTQALLAAWFGQQEEEWGVLVGLNSRVRVTPNRVRLADLVIVPMGAYPTALIEPPLVIIEVVSPEDSWSEFDERMRDYAAMGVPNLWIIDPQQRTARERRGGAWVEVTRLAVPDSPIYVDILALFKRLDKYKLL